MEAAMMEGKKIVLGVCGGIAAYKSAMLVRLLVKQGAEVKVIMTSSAQTFISPLTLATLSKNPVLSHFSSSTDGTWNNHVELGLWADALLIAPATANTLAKMAHGICDNLLLATYLSARCPVLFAPAMDLDMYKHPATRKNIQTLQDYGNLLIPAETGELASGLTGEGRMAEPENIVAGLNLHFSKNLKLNGKKVLISAGPTYEAIDPIRFIGNHSTGKMGIALADKARSMGAEVTLVCGPTTIASNPLIKRINVVSAEEMSEAIHALFPSTDICIMAAAVADYKPSQVATEKIKKKDQPLTLVLEKTHDILGGLGKIKTKKQVLVGFALETQNELEYALGKLEKKNLDLVVLNSLRTPGAGFGHDTNVVTLITQDKQMEKSALLPKTAIAEIILEKVATLAD
jgi:phosphopantothenoylcysteine decarboxylase/phosphopantothenate--cysteine ligase